MPSWCAAALCAVFVDTGCSYDCTADARAGVGIHVVRRSDGGDICDAEVVLHDGKWDGAM